MTALSFIALRVLISTTAKLNSPATLGDLVLVVSIFQLAHLFVSH